MAALSSKKSTSTTLRRGSKCSARSSSKTGRQLVQDISIRLYSLHEIGKILHHAGFRVLEVSGSFELRNRFYGTESRQLLIVAEKRPDATA